MGGRAAKSKPVSMGFGSTACGSAQVSPPRYSELVSPIIMYCEALKMKEPSLRSWPFRSARCLRPTIAESLCLSSWASQVFPLLHSAYIVRLMQSKGALILKLAANRCTAVELREGETVGLRRMRRPRQGSLALMECISRSLPLSKLSSNKGRHPQSKYRTS